MVADTGSEGAIFAYPVTCGDTRIEEKQDTVDYFVALKAHFCRDYTLGARGIIDCSRICGGELNTVLEIKYHLIYRVGLLLAGNTVEHHVAHGDLSLKGLAACLRLDYS